MLVEYIPNDVSLFRISLNVVLPSSDTVDINAHVNMFAPQDKWALQKNPLDFSHLIGTQNSVNPTDYIPNNNELFDYQALNLLRASAVNSGEI